MISETHFTTNTKCSIPSYNLITSNHSDNTAHAGATVLIKSSILFTPCPSIQENFLQAVILTVKLNQTQITIAATYCPLKHKLTPIQYENIFHSLGHYFIVGGELNFIYQSWSCHTSNPKRTIVNPNS